jgi:hypothetical protein
MSVNASPVSLEDGLSRGVETPDADTAGFEARWTAWRARGAAHDRTVRRRMVVALPILAIVAAVLYVLLLR